MPEFTTDAMTEAVEATASVAQSAPVFLRVVLGLLMVTLERSSGSSPPSCCMSIVVHEGRRPVVLTPEAERPGLVSPAATVSPA